MLESACQLKDDAETRIDEAYSPVRPREQEDQTDTSGRPISTTYGGLLLHASKQATLETAELATSDV